MLLQPGEKVHVLIRRAFNGDLRRHFVGEVRESSGVVVRLMGYSFVFDSGKNQYLRAPDRQERIVALTGESCIATVLPPELNLEQLQFWVSSDRQITLTDGEEFKLDIKEFSGGG